MAYIDYYNVNFSDDKASLIKCPTTISGEYRIPEGVLSIKSGAFKDCVSLNTLYLPHSLTEICTNAFSGCKALTNIYYNGTLEDWLTRITCHATFESQYKLHIAFDGKYWEIVRAVIPKTVTEIRNFAFYYCSSLFGVEFHDGIKSIGDSAFNKSNIKGNIEIPQGVTSIGRYSFLSCKNITGISIPESVTSIQDGAFSYCDKLACLSVDEENSAFCTSKDGLALYDKFQTRLIACAGSGPELHLAKSCKSIAPYAFMGTFIQRIYLYNICEKATNIKDVKTKFFVPSGKKEEYKGYGFPGEQIYELYNKAKLYKNGETQLKVFSQNPFRVLGVYSTASPRQISSNSTRLKRYADVGKVVEMETDRFDISPKPSRDSSSIDAAIAQLNLPKDKLKYALFWFPKNDEIDESVYDYILRDDLNGLKSFYRRDNLKESYSTQMIIALHQLMKGECDKFVDNVSRIIRNEEKRASFISQVCGDTFIPTEEETRDLFIDTLLEEWDGQQLYAALQSCPNCDLEANLVKDKVIGKFTSIINSEVAKAKRISVDDADGNLLSAKSMIQKTKGALSSAKSFLGSNDDQYKILADTLSKQILQCGINYFKSSDDEDAAQMAYEIITYASSIAEGKIIKDRCGDNANALKRIIASLPPHALKEFNSRFAGFISSFKILSFEHVEPTIDKAGPYIGEINEYISQCSNDDDRQQAITYKTNVSTKFAEVALSNLIDLFNREMAESDKHKDLSLSGIDSSLPEKIKIIIHHWNGMTMIASLCLSEDFKNNRLNSNKETLRRMFDDFVGRIRPNRVIDCRSENEIFKVCSNDIDACYLYLNRYPNGNHTNQVNCYLEDMEWNLCKTISDYRSFVKRHPNGAYCAQSLSAIAKYEKEDQQKWEQCKHLSDLQSYVKEYPEGAHKKEAENRISNITTRLKWLSILGVFVIIGLIITICIL